MGFLKKTKDQLYYYFACKNSYINNDYYTYKALHLTDHQKNRLRSWKILLDMNVRYRILRKKDYLYYDPSAVPAKAIPQELLLYYRHAEPRLTVDALLDQLASYDMISFDIFDTALLRKVDRPNRVFYIMGHEMGFNDFTSARKSAESRARALKERTAGTREVVLDEIYDLLWKHAGIDPKWKDREIELELQLSCTNPYIFAVYKRLLEQGKRIIFTSDMYLPLSVIESLLQKNGYTQYEKVFLSNEYGVNKGEGMLQRVVLDTYPGINIVHVGDTLKSDIEKSEEVGLPAIFNRNVCPPAEEFHMDNFGGAFYQAIINNNMNNGLWKDSLYYDHGFRVGGIIAVGYCQFINRIAREKNIEKILFCSRDCWIVHDIYNRYFRQYDNEYLQISRYAILNLCSDRYAYDLMGRCIMRYMHEFRSSKTIGTILEESGYGYLVPYLEDNDLDQFLFPQAVAAHKIEKFILDHLAIIKKHNESSVQAAKDYYDSLIGDSKRILVVDIGWSGSCITMFKYFLETHFPEKNLQLCGTLACTSRNWPVTISVESHEIDTYLYSPMHNMDTTRNLFPGGKQAQDRDLQDRRHLPMECLFTSNEASLLDYQKTEDGAIEFVRRNLEQPNPDEIAEMQAGMVEFARQYVDFTSDLIELADVPPYVAITPYTTMLSHPIYCCAVYRNFVYDTPMAPFDSSNTTVTMEKLYGPALCTAASIAVSEAQADNAEKPEAGYKEAAEASLADVRGRLLFISPELTQTGTPRSLLRMCRVALNLNYYAELWTAKDGPFRREYEALGVPVKVVPESSLKTLTTKQAIASFDMAICNTIVTDEYERACSSLIPTVWYIREATNIPDFINSNWARKYTLEHSENIYCVSDYAAEAIGKFTNQPIRIIHNCVEDEVEFSSGYISGTGAIVKFVQFGTMEYRKGYDVLLAAYLKMPENYRKQSALYFAGGFINSGTPYCSYLFSRMKNEPNIHYLGVVRGEENKIQTLSNMDVVVVASRDESCSLVALEGAMLSKPLIVTENVGAKYVVDDQNGYVVKTADTEDLARAMMSLIDRKSSLAEMGKASREKYEQYANMDSYTKSMQELYSHADRYRDGKFSYTEAAERNRKIYSRKKMDDAQHKEEDARNSQIRPEEHVIVSLTSHPARMSTIIPCIQSLINQNSKPDKILLWLAKPQFPDGEANLPQELLDLVNSETRFEIRWTDDDLAPHKKYYYTMLEYPDLPVITVDDDVIYDPNLVSRLMDSYRKFPDCISAMRTNLMLFKSDGTLLHYDGWIMGYTILKDTPSCQLMPTGVGGVLYPPHSVPDYAFDKDAIIDNCLYTDDLWLKVATFHNGYKAVLVKDFTGYKEIEAAKESALWRMNVHRNRNDEAMNSIIDYYDHEIGIADDLLSKIRRDRAI